MGLVDQNNPWSIPDFVRYQNSFYLIPISIFAYVAYCLLQLSSISEVDYPKFKSLLLTIISLLVLVTFIHLYNYFAWGVLHIDLLIDYRYFNYGILLIILISSLTHIYHLNKSNLNSKTPSVVDNKDSTIEIYLENSMKVEKYFQNSKMFLNPDLNLETIGKDLSISKHALSALFNKYYKTGFHFYLANLRILYAKQMLDDNSNLTIEFVAASSGFNSKSSFNKYFKEILKVSPSEYVENTKRRMEL